MSTSDIINIQPLGFPWITADPFLFCAYHLDNYPKGNSAMGPGVSLAGRSPGQDFDSRDGWNMYHGSNVPGFPAHPHRGFETITIVKSGVVDHADSMGAAGRFSTGDVQWMTAGKGVQHSEMFPLLENERNNPLELFQIWLNLPATSKMAEPHFSMFWNDQIPRQVITDSAGLETHIDIIAGSLDEVSALAPPPDSWAADSGHRVNIWTITMAAGARWQLPATAAGISRTLYVYAGDQVTVADRPVMNGHALQLQPEAEISIHSGGEKVSLLLLEGKPLNEPVAQHGPFVMNTNEQLREAFADYQRTQYGGWPWPTTEQVHERNLSRFAKHADGTEEFREL